MFVRKEIESREEKIKMIKKDCEEQIERELYDLKYDKEALTKEIERLETANEELKESK